MDSNEDFYNVFEYNKIDFLLLLIIIGLAIFILYKIFKRNSREHIRNLHRENENNYMLNRSDYYQDNEFINNNIKRNNSNIFKNTNNIGENHFSNNGQRNFNSINSHSNSFNNLYNSTSNYNTINNINNNKENNLNNGDNYLGERFISKRQNRKNGKVNKKTIGMENIPHKKNNQFHIDNNFVHNHNYDNNNNNFNFNNNKFDFNNNKYHHDNNINNNYNFNEKNLDYNNNNNYNFNEQNLDYNNNNNYNFDNYNHSIINNNNNNGISNNTNNFDKLGGFIIDEISEEPKIGLNNIGATCYMNATLQCFSHTIKLTNYFFFKKHQNWINSDENILSQSYLEVLKKLWIRKYNNNKSNYSPNDFKNIISQMDPLFMGIAANDSKDLINFILQQLHSELNKTKYENNSFNLNNINLNQNDEQVVLKYFLEDYKRKNQSIISDLFFGIIETVTECLLCKQRNQLNGIFNPFYSYNFQIINFIIFPLEEIRKAKGQALGFNLKEVNIYDCFDFYQKEDIMQGDNQMWCKYCRQNTNSKYCTLIYSSPEYFILILNRGKGNKYNVKLNFEEVIDISRFVKIKKNIILKYQLYAVVTHIGPSSMSGHFISFCRSPIDRMWYKFNDSQVDFMGKSFNSIHEFGCPYILFYERQEL